jgi:hypothetical protein
MARFYDRRLGMKSMFVGVMAVVVLAGCGNDVPSVQDPDRIVVRGKLISQQDFMKTYCEKDKDNDSCVRVAKAMSADSVKAGHGVARN